jgi:hypothetical protein
MRGQRPRNLFSVRCDGWMCQIGDSIDFHEREISRTSQAIAKLLIIGATVSMLRTGLENKYRSIIEKSKQKQTRPRHRLQHRYCPLLAMFYALAQFPIIEKPPPRQQIGVFMFHPPGHVTALFP